MLSAFDHGSATVTIAANNQRPTRNTEISPTSTRICRYARLALRSEVDVAGSGEAAGGTKHRRSSATRFASIRGWAVLRALRVLRGEGAARRTYLGARL